MGRAAAGAAATGLLLWLAAPPVGAGWLAWVALVPAASVALHSEDERARRLAVPLAYGVYLELLLVPALPFGIAAGQYGDPPLPLLVDGSPVFGVALVAVPAFCAVLWLLRFGSAWGPGLAGSVLLPALSWTALDLLRVKLDPGGLWGPLFLSQHDLPPASMAALAGPVLVTFAIAATGYALAHALSERRRLVAVAALAATVTALTVAGAMLRDEGDRRIGVAALQPGYDTAEEGIPETRFFARGTHHLAALDTIRDLGAMTAEAARRGAEVVVWPEASLFVDPRTTPGVEHELRALAARTGALVVLPYFVRDRREGETLLVTRSGLTGVPQPKQRPMWWWSEDDGNRVPPAPARAGGVAVGTLLGVDGQDAGVGARLAGRGADLLAAATHDWERLAGEHRAFARVQSAATGLPLVRSDWRFGSAIFDAGGHLLAEAPPGKRRVVLTATVSAGGGSPYGAMGDLFGWAAAALVGLVALGRALSGAYANMRSCPTSSSTVTRPSRSSTAPPTR